MRKTWMKRLITVTLAAVMAAGTLAGCQSGASNAGGNASEPSAQSSDAPASKAEKAEASQTTGAAAGQTSEKKDGPSDPMDYSTAKINWRAYEGETLRLLLLEHSATDALKPHLDEFTELTGIEVKLETLPENEYNKKLLVEFNSGANPPDVFMSSTPALFYGGGWFKDLKEFINNPELTDPDFYQFDDFLDSAINYATYKDVQFSIPFTGEWQILYYRKDLFDEKGMTPPQNFEEMKEACAAFTDKANGKYGLVARLKKGIGADVIFNNYLSAFGGEFMKADGDHVVCMLNQPQAVEAVDYYMGLLRDYGPEGQVNYGWSEAISEMQSGSVAMFQDATSFIGQLENPEVSKVAGKLGYAAVPRKDGKDTALHFSHWGFSVCSLSKKQEAAWYFVQWLTSKPMLTKCGLTMGATTRASFWENEELKAKYGQEYVDAVLDAASRGQRLFGQYFTPWSESRDVEVAGLHEIYNGADPGAVMEQVAADINRLYADIHPDD